MSAQSYQIKVKEKRFFIIKDDIISKALTERKQLHQTYMTVFFFCLVR